MQKPKHILVTGANGQLGLCIKDASVKFPNYKFYFKNSLELDITKIDEVQALFSKLEFDYCINCAAYTAVDKAESEKDLAYLVNAEAVKYLAEACKEYNAILIHVSTDFVFDGTNTVPYTENDIPNPINIYGASKLKGEKYVQEILEKFFIIRTSWVYSKYGNNFVKSMLRLAKEKDEIGVVNDQIGSPTYAGDLALLILEIIKSNANKYGLYHYSNAGEISWYEFALKIFEISKKGIKLNRISSAEYKTNAQRPKYSILDKNKINSLLKIKPPYWEKSLNKVLQNNIE